MVRASSVHKICTNRVTFDQEKYNFVFTELVEKVTKKTGSFDIGKIEEYYNTSGLKTIVTDYKKEISNKIVAEENALPPGGKSYLQMIWLSSKGFYEESVDNIATKKGLICEDQSIADFGLHYKIPVLKNQERITKGFLSGEADIIYLDTVVDIKNAVSFGTFRNVKDIATEYYWQLIAYCYLYNKSKARLCYVLNPTPLELIPEIVKYYNQQQLDNFYSTEEAIAKLDFSQRHKLFEIPDTIIKSEIEFLTSRLDKAESYYNMLDFNKCMGLNGISN